ncbi:MAG TPA: heme ABC transporter ATP-binding protein [Rhodanobacter sp.]
MNVAIDWIESAQPSGELAAHGLHLERGGRCVLQDVSLCAKPGRLLVLAGPNGAGKSSLLGALAGLLPPSLGKVTLDGRRLSGWSPVDLARRRAMLSQKVQLGFAFRVDEVVLLGRSPHATGHASAEDRRIVDAALHAAHAWELRERRYPELSGGEQQRVQLARVLAQVWERGPAPAWLLLDEPEAGLDIAHQHFVLRHAQRLSRQGYGVIAVLHDLNLAVRYADDVALLVRGRLLRHGSPAHALDPQVLSRVYELPMQRVDIGDGWMLAPV